ncbi:MAG: response regulator, partial [Planctomycetota bacterium]
DGDAIPSLRFHRVAPPVVGPELFEALERATRPRGPLPALDGLARVEARPDRSPTDRAGSASARPMQRTRRPLQVLLVEDDAVNQRVGRLLLESWGHRVEVAAHGRAAVERTGAHEFDAVLMDVDMPEMDGLEATRAVRAREARTGSAPAFLVAMTGRNLEHDRVACREAGMDEHIAKPVDRGELFALLERRGSALERQS